ncbi:MLO-like protein 3 [Telopea speciosissima]|uniref:MLO-like protein 3 n=1 Tax=Telopea speciosissima TaxID=54955 RepID=UPI001CC3AD9B|nr:MLO-like protein 3 [Telopea speciosissima]
MAAGESSATDRSLQDTSTWALATVCFCFISFSILLEHSINIISKWLKKHHKKSLNEAVEKLKSELMLVGFISLILATTQRAIPNICIPIKAADTMLPCRKNKTKTGVKLKVIEHLLKKSGSWHRLLLASGSTGTGASSNSDKCASKGMVSLVSQQGLRQLHIFIFILAATQLVYSLLTMVLGKAKMKRWKAWEEETRTISYQVANDPKRFRFIRQTTFGRRHMSIWTESLWIKCFFRQFFNSVAKVDYLTLRHGFIAAHLPTHSNFNFQQYIQRSLEDDFKVVVGISPPMWLAVVIFMLADVHGWHMYLWVAYAPLIFVLTLGTKLEVIVARMALQLKDLNIVITGAPVVQPNDNLFWFSQPKFVLTLLHFTLFMNAFDVAFFIWVTLEFGINSCYHEYIEITITRVVLAVIVQVICSYITLPLYALVTQMGSHFKSAVLEEQTAKVIKQWYADVKKRQKMKKLTSLPNSEIGSSRKTITREVSSPTTSPRPTRTLSKTISSLNWNDEISQVQEEPGEANVPSRALVVELPILECHEKPSTIRKN